jgi:uncharacterized peroxidase-related enzyme
MKGNAMPRITALTDTAATPEVQAVFSAIKGKIGMVPNLYRTTAHSPTTLAALLGLGDALSKGTLTAREREAIALTVAGANACDYCASAHSAISGGLNVAPDQISAHLRGRSAVPRMAALLSLARSVTEKRGKLGDGDLAVARSADLTDADIIEVIGVVVANIFTNYLNHAFQTDIDFPVVLAAVA